MKSLLLRNWGADAAPGWRQTRQELQGEGVARVSRLAQAPYSEIFFFFFLFSPWDFESWCMFTSS